MIGKNSIEKEFLTLTMSSLSATTAKCRALPSTKHPNVSASNLRNFNTPFDFPDNTFSSKITDWSTPAISFWTPVSKSDTIFLNQGICLKMFLVSLKRRRWSSGIVSISIGTRYMLCSESLTT